MCKETFFTDHEDYINVKNSSCEDLQLQPVQEPEPELPTLLGSIENPDWGKVVVGQAPPVEVDAQTVYAGEPTIVSLSAAEESTETTASGPHGPHTTAIKPPEVLRVDPEEAWQDAQQRESKRVKKVEQRHAKELLKPWLEQNGFTTIKSKRRTMFRYYYPLHLAVFNKDLETVQLLLRAGADPMKLNSARLTALEYARSLDWRGSRKVIIQVLKQHQAAELALRASAASSSSTGSL